MYVKVCGITNQEDARSALDAGVSAIGFNLIEQSKRYITVQQARDLCRYVGQAAHCIAVVAHYSLSELRTIREQTGVVRLQLHGHEPDDWVERLTPWAFRAARIATAEDAKLAASAPGHPLLVDAKVEGQLGGTGKRLDWPLITELAKKRALIVAGGLTPDNVADAVNIVQPFGVDVASGVEPPGQPRRKDRRKMEVFVREAYLGTPNPEDTSSAFLSAVDPALEAAPL